MTADELGQDLPQAPAYNPPAPDASGGGSKLASFGKGLLGVMSGGATSPEYSVDPNTGATVTTQTPNSTGQMFRNMFAGMLSGFAGGVQANANGAHGPLGALAGGASADSARREQIDQQKRSQAQQQFGNELKAKDADQTAKLNQAHLAQISLENAKTSFGLANDKAQFNEAQVKKLNDFSDTVKSIPGASYVGTYANAKAALDSGSPEQHKEWAQQMASGELRFNTVFANDDKGNPTAVGVEVYHLPKDLMNKPIDRELPIGQIHHIDPKTGIDSPEEVKAPVGSINWGEYFALSDKNFKGTVTAGEAFKASSAERIAQTRADSAAHVAQIHADTLLQGIADKEEARNTPLDDATLDAVTNYQASPVSLRRAIGRNPNIIGQIATKSHDWSEGNYEQAVKTMKDFGPGGLGGRTITAMGTAVQHAANLDQLVQRLPDTSDINILNRATATLAKQMGEPNISSYDALQHVFSEEFAKGIKGGVPDVKLQEAIYGDLQNTKGPKALHSAIGTQIHTQYQKMGEQAGEFRQSVPNALTNPYSPNVSKGAEAALHQFGLDNPFNFGQGPKPEHGGETSLSKAPDYVAKQFFKLAGNDPQKARELAAKRGWTK